MTPHTINSPAPVRADGPEQAPTIWGLTARELHDAFWSCHGVQCVRPGEEVELDRHADLYLLIEAEQLVLFDVREVLERLIWSGARVTRVRLIRSNAPSYKERIVCQNGLVQRIERQYGPDHRSSARVFLTKSIELAEQWRSAATPRSGWKCIRSTLRGRRVDSIRVVNGWCGTELAQHQGEALNEIVARWKDPNRAIDGIEEIAEGVWKLACESKIAGPTVVGPVWLGAGDTDREEYLIGPIACPDQPGAAGTDQPSVRIRDIFDIVSGDSSRPVQRANGSLYFGAKRAFDIAVSGTALVILAPIFALVCLAIVLDSGRPVLFGHRRQTRGGSEFHCLKFRTMRRDAEKMAVELASQNKCDGPQVYIPDDPRVTRVGRFLRATNLDELPQLLNVLMGHMSIVGPRPSPERENRCCPAWRDMRLSVRPGITGLWQVSRTRAEGEDFQEWIRYDIEYVKRASFWLDMLICLQTVRVILWGRKS